MKYGHYTIKLHRRKGQKRITVRKLSEDTLKISAPKRMPQRQIKTMLNQHLKTIDTLPLRLDFKGLLARPESLDIFGQPHEMMYQKGRKNIEIKAQKIIVTHPTLSRSGLQRTIYDFLKNQLIAFIKDYHHTLQATNKNFYALPTRLKAHYMHTRFGSANHKERTINLNLALIHYPKRFLKSVYLHELTHFDHPNHSQAFYKTLKRLNPDYLEDKKALESYHLAFQNRDKPLA